MWEFLTTLIKKFGFPAALGLVILCGAVWFVAHRNSEPCEKIALLWGMVEYTKAGNCEPGPIIKKNIKLKYKCWNTGGHIYAENEIEEIIPNLEKEIEVAVSTHDGKWACTIILKPDGSYQSRIYSHNGNQDGKGNAAKSGSSTVSYLNYRMSVVKIN